MSDNITCLAKASGDGTRHTPEMALNDALEDIKNGVGAFKDGKKIVVICLDDTEDNYDVSWVQAGMTMSECLALCEVAKARFLSEMGYLVGEGDL